MKHFFALIFISLLSSTLFGQSISPITVASSSSVYAPSIVTFEGQSKQVAAATVQPTTGVENRRVHIYYSTDKGTTWTDIHTLALPSTSGNAYDNMDDPQLWYDGLDIWCVARVWVRNDAVGTDFNGQGQNGSLFFHSAIVASRSTNYGSTWTDGAGDVLISV